MLNKKKYYLIIWGILVSVISVGPFARPYHGINNSAVVTESNKVGNEIASVSIEANTAVKESKDTKKPEVIIYTVKAGDTVESISGLYGVSTKTIALSNGISENTVLTAGQALKFPSVDGLLYKVNNSETLWNIAMAYKKDINELIAINSLGDPDKLKLNQEIIIPEVDRLFAVKDNSDNKLVAEAKAQKNTLSRGGSISNVIKSYSTEVAWPLTGSITSQFGLRERDNHTGIDIAASIGTPIKAATDGKVVFNGWQDGYGKLIIIQASNGLQTYYAHTSEILVNVGQAISSGQVVAKVGVTGITTGPHLHFEVRKNGNPVNPLNYLK